MILDTSALVAILYREPEAADFVERIRAAEAFFRRAGIIVEPVTIEHGELARQAFLDFGKGRHKAGLNFGDCFAYALAKATGEPLLFKGNDFSQTDIKAT
jgi:ribonuclease VapC